jgi:hypothetical protein
MTVQLEKRIAALEVQTAPAEPLTIIRRFVAPGKLQAELDGLRDTKGTVWRREPGESEQGLIDRASLQAWRNRWGVASLESLF